MKLTIPKTVRLLPLQDYDPENAELAGVGIFVWVDPPRSVLAEFDKLNGEYAAALDALVKKVAAVSAGHQQKPKSRLQGWLDLLFDRKSKDFKPVTDTYRKTLYAWYARLWSQGAPDTHWTAAELEGIEEHNPVFYEWLCRRSWVLISEHRETVKKGLRPPEPKPPEPAAPATGL
jgi:hypothetical protein